MGRTILYHDLLVGSTGFVGGNLLASHHFAAACHSSDIAAQYGTHPDLCVYAGVPAAMFLANADPAADLAVMRAARENLQKIDPRAVVLVSTIAVYADSRGKDETDEPDEAGLSAYGRNRLQLERWVRQDFPDALIVRLPALYGKGLKKNFLYDLRTITPAMLKAEKYAFECKEYEKQQEEIAALEDYVARNIVRATTAKSAQSRVKKLENMERLEKPLPPPRPPRLRFLPEGKSEELSLSVNGLSLSAGGKALFSDAAFEVRRGEKIAIVGENGTGKSTLLRTLVKGRDPAVRWGRYVRVGYYDQENADLDPEETVLGALWHHHTLLTQTEARSLLAQAKLSEEDIDKKVAALSGGERAKLALVLLEAENANFLVLDEPTNHLDLLARESLEEALRGYEGTLLFVSHDRYFIRGLADKVLEIADGKATLFPCGYEEYTAQKRAREEAREAQARAEKAEKAEKAKASSYRSKADRAEETKKKQAIRRTEEQIADVEGRIAALNETIASPAVAADYKKLSEACAELDRLHAELDRLYAQYDEIL